MPTGEETLFTQSTRVGSVNRSHQKWTYIFFPSWEGPGWIPSPRYKVTLLGEPNASSLLVICGGNLQVTKLSTFYPFFPFETLLKVCCISSAQKFSIPPLSNQKKLLSVAPWFQNSIDITKTLLFCSFSCLLCLGKASKKTKGIAMKWTSFSVLEIRSANLSTDHCEGPHILLG